MPNDASNISVSEESLERKHEAHEPDLRNSVMIIISIVFMIAFCLAGAGILAGFFSTERPMQRMQPLGVINAPDLKPFERFPKPNLQIDDDHDQRTILCDRQSLKLNSYGWIDRSNGIVRIPIDRAMDLILQRNLPARMNSISQTDGSALQLIQERPEQR